MANSFKVTDLVAKEVLRVAHETATFIKTSDRQYDETFAYKTGAGKFGQTLRVKSPNQYKRRQGSRVMDVQDQSEATQNITMATQDGVDMRMNSAELLQLANTDGSVNEGNFNALAKHYIIPAAKGLLSAIDADFLAFATKATYQVAGTAGTAITSLTVPGAARAKLNQQLAPKDNSRAIQMDSVTMGALVSGVAAYFAPNAAISEQYTEGFVKRTAMADYYENERVWTMPNSADVAGEINNGTLTSGITNQKRWKFIFFVLVACSLWAGYAAGLGYLFGDRFEKGSKTALLVALGVALALTVLIEVIRRKFRRSRGAEPSML
jgi:hypothetical protein